VRGTEYQIVPEPGSVKGVCSCAFSVTSCACSINAITSRCSMDRSSAMSQ